MYKNYTDLDFAITYCSKIRCDFFYHVVWIFIVQRNCVVWTSVFNITCFTLCAITNVILPRGKITSCEQALTLLYEYNTAVKFPPNVLRPVWDATDTIRLETYINYIYGFVQKLRNTNFCTLMLLHSLSKISSQLIIKRHNSTSLASIVFFF